jgi:hypothetical protein
MTVRGAGSALPAGWVRLRPSVPRRFPLAVMVAYFASTAGSGHHAVLWWLLLAAGGLFGVVSLLDSVTLTPTQAVVRQGPKISVPWDRVQAVLLVRGRVALVTADRRGMVRAPSLAWAPRTNEAARARVEQWWVEHRSPDWTPAQGPANGSAPA